MTNAFKAVSAGKLLVATGLILAVGSASQAIDLKRDLIQKLTHFDVGEDRERYDLETRQLPTFTEHSRLKIAFHGPTLSLRWEYDETALKNPSLLLPDAMLFSYIRNFGAVPIAGLTPKSNALLKNFGPKVTLYALAEMMQNAEAGSLSAKIRMLRWKTAAIEGLGISDAFESQFPGTRAALLKTSRSLKREIRLLLPKAEAPPVFDINREQLKDLVLKNDRAGVANLLRAKLPWSQMQPIERKVWQAWVSAIESPDVENATWLFRGFQSAEGFQRSHIEANGRDAFLAPRFSPTNEQYDIERVSLGDAKLETVHKITDLLEGHAEAFGGPTIFMSFSSSFDVAEGFVAGTERMEGPPGELIAVKVDPRRASANFLSSFGREFEYLAPLIIFPDEVQHIKRGYIANDRESFLRAVKAKGFIEKSDEETAKAFRADGATLLKHDAPSSCRELFKK